MILGSNALVEENDLYRSSRGILSDLFTCFDGLDFDGSMGALDVPFYERHAEAGAFFRGCTFVDHFDEAMCLLSRFF